jgi:hypothetical protein
MMSPSRVGALVIAVLLLCGCKTSTTNIYDCLGPCSDAGATAPMVAQPTRASRPFFRTCAARVKRARAAG